MRTLAALLLAFSLVTVAAEPHVHAGAGAATDDCAVCVLRHTVAPRAEAPDVTPLVIDVGEAVCAPGLPPVSGAPLGAVPGQSPPAGA